MKQMQMQVQERTFFKKFEYPFAIIVLALNIVGLINLFSATHGAHSSMTSRLFLAQFVWLAVGWILFICCTLIEYQFFLRASYFIYVLNLLSLGLVMFFGKVSYGAQRWLDLGFFRYQPSETMKLSLVLVLAKTLSKFNPNESLGIKQLFWPLILVFIPFVMTVKQPDLGTAMMLIAIACSMILFIGVKKQILIVVTAVGLMAAVPIWFYGLKDYQKNRVITFIYPERDPRGSGYNSIQSKIAVGSGGIMGRGWKKGTQSQLEFLPERHTDFIFSVLSEEHGFLGSILTISLFMFLFVKGVEITRQARDKAGVVLSIGVLSYLFWHVFVNIGMVISLLPIVGIPLPLLSYGGSSMITTMTGLGLVSSVAFRKYFF